MPESRIFRFFVALRELWRDRRPWVLAGLVVSAALAFFSSSGSQTWTATTQAFVDSSTSVLGAIGNPVDPLQEHAGVYTNILASQAGVDAVARASGVPRDRIAVTNLGGDQTTPQSYSLSSVLTAPYSLQLRTWDLSPEILITARAPTRKDAVGLANGAVRGLVVYLRSIGDTGTSSYQAAIRQLGAPVATSAGGGGSVVKLAINFFLVLAIWCGLIRLIECLLEAWRSSPRRPRREPTPFDDGSAVEWSSSAADRTPETAGSY